MSDGALRRLAKEAGLAPDWTDAHGKRRRVAPAVLRAVLEKLSLPAANPRQIADGRARLRTAAPSPLTVVDAHGAITARGRHARFLAEDGRAHDAPVRDGKAVAPSAPGYYRLDGEDRRIAVAPPRAFLPERRFWGVAAQLYALRGSAGFGDFAALAAFARQAAGAGADAVAISPVHALFGADLRHIGPYAPSSRLFLNPLYAPARLRDAGGGRLIDWPRAAARKLSALAHAFAQFRRSGRDRAMFEDFVRAGGARLLAHARFEVLDARQRREGIAGWRNWPAAYRNPQARAVRALGRGDSDVAFQLFLQWQADRALAAAQTEARAAGMEVGLITDMAVGMDPDGSHAWSAPGEVLNGLSIGAPPDIFNPAGQDWGLTNFSPQGLAASGFDGFIATLRAAMRHSGGLRLDHAMGLMRLWVIPEGAGPCDGVYLHYPFAAMLRLLMLESWRHRALVIAEDLGTVPAGFRPRIARAGLLGMRVLWFERDGRGFKPPQAWNGVGAALSTTHDLPTLVGWWQGRDLAWQRKLGADAKTVAAKRKARAKDRRKLWRMLRDAGCASGRMPGPAAPARLADAAIAALAKTRCALVLPPVEDFLGEAEQPNIPGTIDQHPNWRRRLNTATPFAEPAARRRAALLRAERP